jgi:hypothetical protein
MQTTRRDGTHRSGGRNPHPCHRYPDVRDWTVTFTVSRSLALVSSIERRCRICCRLSVCVKPDGLMVEVAGKFIASMFLQWFA